MRLYLFSLAIIFPLFAKAVGDTTWFDKKWNEVSRDSALYFRLSPVKTSTGKYLVRDFYLENGKLVSTIIYKDSLLKVADGPYTYYYSTGGKQAQGSYKHGAQNGFCRLYDEQSGNVVFEGTYENGFFNGEVVCYYLNGKVERKEKYRKGKLKSGVCFTKTGSDTTYFPDRRYPHFPGGDGKYKSYVFGTDLYKQFKGKVGDELIYVHALFDEDGKIYDAYIEGHPTPTAAEAAAISIINSMPKWEPAVNSEGIRIKSDRDLDILFK